MDSRHRGRDSCIASRSMAPSFRSSRSPNGGAFCIYAMRTKRAWTDASGRAKNMRNQKRTRPTSPAQTTLSKAGHQQGCTDRAVKICRRMSESTKTAGESRRCPKRSIDPHGIGAQNVTLGFCPMTTHLASGNVVTNSSKYSLIRGNAEILLLRRKPDLRDKSPTVTMLRNTQGNELR